MSYPDLTYVYKTRIEPKPELLNLSNTVSKY